jgi:RNA-splicing ligase RtcB
MKIMIEIKGSCNTAICFTDTLEETAEQQIRLVCELPEFSGSAIRIMPDVHAGKGCTIGTTMTIEDKVVPGMVGVDIGCGMETVEIEEKEMDFEKLDAVIREGIPGGREVRDDFHPLNNEIDLTALKCAREVNLNRAYRSIGTLGGGNHFIEVGKSSDGTLYIVVHSGSRYLGTEVASLYQDEAVRQLAGNSKQQLSDAIRQLKAEGRQKEIQETLERLKREGARGLSVPKDLAYASGCLFEDYIHDMKIIQHFAALNRRAMTDVIISGMGLTKVSAFTTIHNYIDTESMILRKGAVSAKLGEKLLIPINMRDGSLICVGKGNPNWNFSAPHGAGRIMSRSKALGSLSMNEYRQEMEGIFTTSVSEDTLDESPMAYKSLESILGHIEPTVEVVARIRPAYNFKASE